MLLEPPDADLPERTDLPDLAQLLGRHMRAGALSPNTERALRADLAVFAGWCEGQGLCVLPARAETIAAFIDAMAELKAPATVRRYVASIALAHRAIGRGKVAKSPLPRLALKRMHRKRGRRQDQAHGLTWPLRQRLMATARDRLIDARNRALLAVAYDGMLRRAELTALLTVDLFEELQGDGTLLVRRSKTDGEGRGETAWLAPDSMRLGRGWLDRAGIGGGRLFRSVGKGGRVGERLDPSQVPRIFKAMAREAGLPEEVAEGLSGHSARVGAAQDMVAAGVELPKILHSGRWKSTAMVHRYGERLLARCSGAAELARLQKRL